MDILEIRKYWQGIVTGNYKTGYNDIQYKIDNGVLYFSASNSYTDIITNLCLFSKHAFMERCMNTFWEIILDGGCYNKDVLLESPKNIHTVVGYSLGGAIAQAFVSLFEDRTFKVVVFGSPRVPRGFKINDSNMYRIVYGSDIVTKLPPFGKKFGKRLDFGRKNMLHCICDHNDKNYGGI